MASVGSAPLVSVCMCTYCHRPFIREAIEGVMMQQTSFPVELVIGEDYSPDGTREVCEELEAKYPGRIRLLSSVMNHGQSGNLARTLAACRGEYVALCEGDDFWTDPEKLQKQINFLRAQPRCVLCYHRICSVDEHGRLLSCDEPTDRVVFYRKEDMVHVFVPTPGMVFRNCIFELPDEFHRVKSTDAFLVAMLSRHGGAADLGFIGACYRRHGGGLYNSLPVLERYKQSIHTRKVMRDCGYFEEWQKTEIRRELVRRVRMYALGYLKKIQLRNAIRIVRCYLQ